MEEWQRLGSEGVFSGAHLRFASLYHVLSTQLFKFKLEVGRGRGEGGGGLGRARIYSFYEVPSSELPSYTMSPSDMNASWENVTNEVRILMI